MYNKNCCIPKVLVSTYTPSTTSFVMNTPYNFSNAVNRNCFTIVLEGIIPSLTTITPVVLAAPNASLLIMDPIGNLLMSDQLSGVHEITGVYGVNPPHIKLRSLKNRCGCEMRLKRSAFYSTVELADILNSDVESVKTK